MKPVLSAAMLLAVPLTLAFSSPTSAKMTSASCRPLTAENQQACCDDPKWSTLIQQGDKQFCSRRSATDKVRLGRKLNTRAGQISPDDDVPTGSVDKLPQGGSLGPGPDDGVGSGSGGSGDGDNGPGDTGNGGHSGVGNPGNGKDVGRAGEKGMDHGDSPSGTRGNSN